MYDYYVIMCVCACPGENPLALPPGNRTSTAASIMAVNTRKKRYYCNICDVGFDFPSKLVRHFTSSRHKLLENRYPATPVNHSMPCSHKDEVFRLHNDCCLESQLCCTIINKTSSIVTNSWRIQIFLPK